MTKPDDIPQDVWESALRASWVASQETGAIWGSEGGAPAIARAIMAEREACAQIAEASRLMGPVPPGITIESIETNMVLTSVASRNIAAAIRNRGAP